MTKENAAETISLAPGMYIRKVSLKNRKTKKTYHTYKLVESTRTEKGPRQKTLFNQGVYFDLEKAKWRELCRLIEERLGGHRQITAFDPDAELNRLAEQIVFRLTDKMIKEQASGRPLYDGRPGQRRDRTSRKRRGRVGLPGYDQKTGSGQKKLLELGFSQKQISMDLGTITARLLFPDSERSSFWKLGNKSGLGELIDFDFNSVSLNRFYEIIDKLLSKKDKL